ncbi:MAG TPA: glycosyltransferase family 4 protein [Clostridia bacterium]|nr:glycosyltransferase family 4 protein [Clostridia bacterium]
MKIAMFTLMNLGGMIHYTSQFANSLSKYANVHVIIGSQVDKNLFNENISLHLIELNPIRSLNRYFLDLKNIINVLDEINPDIIHISGNSYWIFGLYFYLKKRNVVLTVHDVNIHLGEKYYLANILTNKVHLNLARHYFVHGENLKDLMIKKGYSGKDISVIKHGDYSFFTKYTKDGVQEDGSVLFFGRILDYKGLEYLIETVPIIKKQLPNINVIIAGNGDFAKYNSLIKSPQNFEIINEFIPDEHVAELFQRASVVVLPYIEGSQTGIIPIASSFKKPAISTNVGSIPEIIEDGVTGYIVPSRNVDLLADSIVKILKDDTLRKQMGEKAYAKMKKELSWDAIAKDVIPTYRRILGNEALK